MRVVRFYAPRDVRVEDAPEPSVGPGELVIRVRNCSVCGTDAKIWRSGHPNLRPPRVLGHEVAGEVLEVGGGADGWAVGDRVQVIASIPDLERTIEAIHTVARGEAIKVTIEPTGDPAGRSR